MNKPTQFRKIEGVRQQKRLLEAKRNLQEIQKRIAPFTKRRPFKKYPSAGQWCETSDLSS